MRRNDKIKDIEALAEKLKEHRSNGEKIVQCHGVFDPQHIGHIRHFEQAKALGDRLVVTVTPDRYVNKGPHRPVFNEALRAESIAALSCVDYVSINKWPMAVEAIELLRPDFYVKGREYSNGADDLTDGIALEEKAIKSVGGQLTFTDDITFSASNLVNRHLPVFPEEVRNYLSGFASRYNMDGILGYMDGAKDLKVLVLGETIIDEYQYCQAIGKSSKEPILAVKHISLERFAGGILAVGNHVANFCDSVGLTTFLGTKPSHEEFIREKLNERIEETFLYQIDAPTIVKRRFVEEYFFSKLLEFYEISDEALTDAENESLCAALNKQVPNYDLVIVVDFGHGMITKEAIDILCNKARFLAVNAQSNAGNLGYHTISRYPRADYVCMTETEIRLEARDRYGDLQDIMSGIAQKMNCEYLVVTRGKSGCICYSRAEGFSEAPAFATNVVDRVGAGDTFLSITALCLAQKAPMEMVGFIGNAAGAQAVATVGNSTPLERVPFLKHIESLLK